ncbi:MAG: hypothetical protein ACI837_001999 [Crocinitomicaceae bacterium]|jgi:hypothetical protein
MSNPESNPRFKTKTGYCHVLEDQLVLTRHASISGPAKRFSGNSVPLALILQVAFAGYLIYSATINWEESRVLSIFHGVLSILLLVSFVTSLKNLAMPVIARKSIREVKFVAGVKGLTRSNFAVIYTDKNGKLKKRLILLPGTWFGPNEEIEHAKEVMKNEGYI